MNWILVVHNTYTNEKHRDSRLSNTQGAYTATLQLVTLLFVRILSSNFLCSESWDAKMGGWGRDERGYNLLNLLYRCRFYNGNKDILFW